MSELYREELEDLERDLKRIIAGCGMPSMKPIYEARMAEIKQAKKTAKSRLEEIRTAKSKLNKIYNEDCLETMARMPDGFVDLVVTSPPYDDVRMYKGFTLPIEEIAKELYRTTKDGNIYGTDRLRLGLGCE